MRRRALLVLIVLSPLILEQPAAAQTQKPSKDATVWVVDDTHKVHPVTGNLLSHGKEVYAGRLLTLAEYRLRNNVWDAATNTVKLFAGRNEFAGFQVVLEKGQDDLHKVFVNPTDLLGTNGRISADSHIRLFKQLYAQLDGVWYPRFATV